MLTFDCIFNVKSNLLLQFCSKYCKKQKADSYL
jgi:hypothetical protein